MSPSFDWLFVCLFVLWIMSESELLSLANNRMDYGHSSLSASPFLSVCVFLRSPLDLVALAINWFSHLASAFWGMTATARFCLLHPDPATAREHSAYAEKGKVFFYAALLKESQTEQAFSDNMLHHPPSSWWAHTCSLRTQTQERWGWKEAQHQWHYCRSGITDRDN